MDRFRSVTSQPTSRRAFAIGLVLAGAVPVSPRAAHATRRQEGDLAADFPPLDITVSNAGYEGVPASVAAGRYHVTISTPPNQPFGGFGAVAFMRPPEGMTPDELLAAYGIAPPGASPVTQSGDEGGGPPPAIYEASYAGGTVLGPDGSPGSIVLDLTEGQWIAWADEPDAPHAPVPLSVTGEFPAEVATPAADITVTLVDFGIEIEGNLVAGSHVLRILNEGAEPHFLLLERYVGQETLDNELFAALLEAEMTGAAPPVDFDPERDLVPVAIALTQSTGTTTWLEASLESGTHLATCFFPGAETGVPHAMMGMHQVVEVTE